MEMFTGIFFIVVAVWMFFFFAYINTTGWCFPVYKIGSLVFGLCSAFLALHHYGFILQIG